MAQKQDEWSDEWLTWYEEGKLMATLCLIQVQASLLWDLTLDKQHLASILMSGMTRHVDVCDFW